MQLTEEQVQCSDAAPTGGRLERLEADADEGRRDRGGDARSVDHRRILHRVGPAAEAVLEVDAQVLDRLTLELALDPRQHPVDEGLVQPDSCGQHRGVRRVLIKRCAGGCAPLGDEIGVHPVPGHVHGVHRLP